MTSHVGAMNSCIVRQTHSIFSLFLWLYKEQEHLPVNHKVITKFSCLVIIRSKNTKPPLVTAARVHNFSYPFSEKRDHMGKKVTQMKVSVLYLGLSSWKHAVYI